MTDNFYVHFYQVVDFSFLKPLNPLPSSTFLPDLTPAIFHISPYIYPPHKDSDSYPITDQDTLHALASLQALNVEQNHQFLKAYQQFKHPKFGKTNPHNFSNPYWQWVITHQLSAWQIENIIVDNAVAENKFDVPPLWGFERMGQTITKLADGRTLYIGGEYEDYYDPDFCIYNDVIVRHPDGRIETYGYPRAVFPPTDFHTATLVGDYIYFIGSIGYVDERRYSHTPVYRLNIYTLKIDEVATRNSMGWIYKHKAVLNDNRIVVTGGQYMLDLESPIMDNIDTWELNLNTLIWKNITHRDRHWQRFYVARRDGGFLNIGEYRQLVACQNDDNIYRARLHALEIIESIGRSPDLDSYQQLFVPPISHEIPSDWDNEKEIIDYHKIIFIDGVKVGYKSDSECIQVIIEGKLTDEMLELMQQNLRHKLSKVENMACEVIVL